MTENTNEERPNAFGNVEIDSLLDDVVSKKSKPRNEKKLARKVSPKEVEILGKETGFPSRSVAAKKDTAKVDGRSLRRTNRTSQLNLKVEEGTKEKLMQLAEHFQAASLGEQVEMLIDDALAKLNK